MSVREVPAGPWSPPIVYSWYQEAELKSFPGGSVGKESKGELGWGIHVNPCQCMTKTTTIL